jgi:acetylornithine deacetylase/succinyl-diaminopimelate desuccinylase-like protein
MEIPVGFDRDPWRQACGEATALLQALLRIDTTNPPGNEKAAAQELRRHLEQDGLGCVVIEPEPGRGNLICRLRSGTEEPALLLATHLDVVPAGDPGRWTHPPFGGVLADGQIWGRGAVDMKNMVAMSAMVMKLLSRREVKLRRDIIFAAVADEEAGCTLGSRFLVEQHPEHVRAGFALGEVGGFPISVGGARLCLVQTAEKGNAWLRLTARGPTGHGSMPTPDSAVLRLCRALTLIGSGALPQHNTPVVEAFVATLADALPKPNRWVLPQILNRYLSPVIIDRLIKDRSQARNFHALLHNTASPTMLAAGEAINVIPGEAEARIDGRTVPGQSARDLVRELQQLVGDPDLQWEVAQEAPGIMNHPPDSELWDCIRAVVGQRDPSLTVTPYMIPGFTDGKYFSQLGTRWYGFSPLRLDLDAGPAFGDLFHGLDERLPEDGFHWGLGVLWDVVNRFCAVE